MELGLVKAGFVYMEGDKHKISLPGSLFVRIFIGYRKLVGAKKGG